MVPDRDTALALVGCWTGNPVEPCESCGTRVTLIEFTDSRNRSGRFEWVEPLRPVGTPYLDRVWRVHDLNRCAEMCAVLVEAVCHSPRAESTEEREGE